MPADVPANAAGTREVSSPSAYRLALDRTTRVVERRARGFRNLVIAVVLIGVASVVWAVGARSPRPLAGLLLLVPACGWFFLFDARLLDAWRSDVVAAWVRRDLDLAAFRQALAAYPGLPGETAGAMLATLPSTGDLAAEQRVATPTRRAVAAETHLAHRRRAGGLLIDVAIGTLVATAVAAAAWAGTSLPLLALVALALRPALRSIAGRRHIAARDAELASCRRERGFDEGDYARLTADVG